MRPEGTLKLSSNIEPRMNAPLDARLVVPTRADLFLLEYFYKGMVVSVSAGGLYQLTGDDPTVEENWASIGGDSGAILEPRIAAIEDGTADIKHTITSDKVKTIFEDEFEVMSSMSVAERRGKTAIVAYTRSAATPFEADWLSYQENGTALEPETNRAYIIKSDGDYKDVVVIFNGTLYEPTTRQGKPDDQMFYVEFPASTKLVGNFNQTGYSNSNAWTRWTNAITIPQHSYELVVYLNCGNGNAARNGRIELFVGGVSVYARDAGAWTYTYRKKLTEEDWGKTVQGKCSNPSSGSYSKGAYINSSSTVSVVEQAKALETDPMDPNGRLNTVGLVEEMANAVKLKILEYGITDQNYPVVATKTDLYSIQNTYRGMVVYVIDEDRYYKLVNDLPAYSASWVEYDLSGLSAITEGEIDAMFS